MVKFVCLGKLREESTVLVPAHLVWICHGKFALPLGQHDNDDDAGDNSTLEFATANWRDSRAGSSSNPKFATANRKTSRAVAAHLLQFALANAPSAS